MRRNSPLPRPSSALVSLIPVILTAALFPLPRARAQVPQQEAGAKSVTHTRETAKVTTLPDKSKRYALVIGIDRYDNRDITPLNGAVNDAKMIADALVKYAGFERGNVTVITSDEANPMNRPSRSVILQALKSLKNRIDRDGMLLVAFSGHGVERRSDMKAFLLPQDASPQPEDYDDIAISVDRVKTLIKETNASQVMLLLDSCRNDPASGKGAEDNKATKNYNDAFDLKGTIRSFVTLYAAREGQRAWEYQEKNQGYFSWAFVEALKGAAADENTGQVTLDNLLNYVRTEVPKKAKWFGKDQQPYYVMEGYEGSLVLSSPRPPKRPVVIAPPAPVAPTTGKFSVVSEPGTQLLIEPLTGDKSQVKRVTIPEGQRTYTSDALPLGSFRVTASREGYAAEAKQVDLAANNLAPVVDLPLKPLTYKVTIKTNALSGRLLFGAKGEAPRAYDFKDGQVRLSELRRGEYALNLVSDEVGFEPRSETLTVTGDAELEYTLRRRVRERPLDADFRLPDQWRLPAGWRGTRILEVEGEGLALLNEEDRVFASHVVTANVDLVGGSSVSFVMRAKDDKNYYLVRVCGPRDAETPNMLRFFVVKDGRRVHLQSSQFPPSLSQNVAKEPFSLIMKAEGGRFEFFARFAGERENVLHNFGSVSDATFAEGTVGMAGQRGDRAKVRQFYVCVKCPADGPSASSPTSK